MILPWLAERETKPKEKHKTSTCILRWERVILDILTERKTAPLPLPSSWTKWPKSALYIGEGEVHTYKYQVWQRGCGNDENVNGVQSLSSCLIKSIRWCRPPVPRDIPILPPTGSVQCTRWSPVTYITSDPSSALPRLGHQDEVKSRGILTLLPHSPDSSILPPAVLHCSSAVILWYYVLALCAVC